MTASSTEIRQSPDTRGFIIQPAQTVANAIGENNFGREEPWPGIPARNTTTVFTRTTPGVIKLPLGEGSRTTPAETGGGDGGSDE